MSKAKGKAKQNFRKTDLDRAMRVARDQGKNVKVFFPPDGGFEMEFIDPDSPGRAKHEQANEWDANKLL